MKAKLITLFLVIFQISVLAQHKFLPIIDSLFLCSYNKGNIIYTVQDKYGHSYPELEIFYIVDEMPEPKIPVNEIDSLLKGSIRLNAQELDLHGNIYLQGIVNCKGQAGDYQIIDCPTELVNIGCQIRIFFRECILNWSPPMQQDKNVDLLVRVKVAFNKGEYDIVAPFY